MRSIILTTSLACLAAAGATAAPWTGAPAAGARCANDPLAHLARPGKGVQFKNLIDLPPADAFLAVFRRDANGCIVPVKIDYRYGRPSGRPPVQPPRR